MFGDTFGGKTTIISTNFVCSKKTAMLYMVVFFIVFIQCSSNSNINYEVKKKEKNEYKNRVFEQITSKIKTYTL